MLKLKYKNHIAFVKRDISYTTIKFKDFSKYSFIQLTYIVSKYIDNHHLIGAQSTRNKIDTVRLINYVQLDEELLQAQTPSNNMFSKISSSVLEAHKFKLNLTNYDFDRLMTRMKISDDVDRRIIFDFIHSMKPNQKVHIDNAHLNAFSGIKKWSLFKDVSLGIFALISIAIILFFVNWKLNIIPFDDDLYVTPSIVTITKPIVTTSRPIAKFNSIFVYVLLSFIVAAVGYYLYQCKDDKQRMPISEANFSRISNNNPYSRNVNKQNSSIKERLPSWFASNIDKNQRNLIKSHSMMSKANFNQMNRMHFNQRNFISFKPQQ